MSVVIYHNPRCTKSRQTLQLLQDKGIEPEVVEYLNNTPNIDSLKKILKALGMKPREILRTKEDAYKECGLENSSLSDEEILKIMVKNPKLIERPIVANGSKAAIGRPPENILNIL